MVLRMRWVTLSGLKNVHASAPLVIVYQILNMKERKNDKSHREHIKLLDGFYPPV